MDDVDLAEVMAAAQRGDESAIRQLLGRFEDEIRMVVRGKLPRTLRSQFDSMDFVQSVWQDVFAKEGVDLSRFESPAHFFGFLSGVARNKVYEEHRRRTQTRKYDVGRQEPLYVMKGNREVPRDVAGNDPSPSQEAQGGDRLAQLLRDRSPLERKVVELRTRGLTFEEIGRAIGTHESVPRRMVEDIRRRMEARERP